MENENYFNNDSYEYSVGREKSNYSIDEEMREAHGSFSGLINFPIREYDLLIEIMTSKKISITDYSIIKSLNEFPDFRNVFCFSAYHFLLINSNLLNSEVFQEIFKNLKIVFQIVNNTKNKTKYDLPIVYYPLIEKSLIYINQYMLLANKFANESNMGSLKDAIEFLSILMNSFKSEQQDEDLFVCLFQMDIFKENLKKINSCFNNINKNTISFYLSFFPEIDVTKRKHYNLHYSEDCMNKNNNNYIIIENQDQEIRNMNKLPVSILKNNEINNNRSLNSTMDKSKITPEIVTHDQEKARKKVLDHNNSNNIIKKNNSINENNKLIGSKLTSKTKTFSKNHYTKEIFNEKFIKQNSLNLKEIYSMLTIISKSFYKEKVDFCSIKSTHLEFDLLKTQFNSSNSNYSLELIGSLSQGLYSNLETRTEIDILIRCLNYDLQHSISKLIDDIKKFNEKNIAFKIEMFSLGMDETENPLLYRALLHSFRNEDLFSVNMFVLKDDFLICNNILKKIFSVENLKILHIFYQEILISKIKMCEYRNDVATLILAFLESHFKLFDLDKKKDINFKEPFVNNDQIEFMENSKYYFEINETNLENISKIEVGELLLEFMRYLINFMKYLNIVFNKSKTAKNEFFLQIFCKDRKSHYISENYFFNLEFMYAYLDVEQEIFVKKIIKGFTVQLEDIFFKICENSYRIKNYEQIIDNIILN